MRIHAYTFSYNEELLLPYFFRHYGPLCERIIVHDNGSTDASRDIIRSQPNAVLREWSLGVYSDSELRRLKNDAWKESRGRADWVIVVDADEFLWHTGLAGLLEGYSREGVTLPKVDGFEMVSEAPPRGSGQIWEEIPTGYARPDLYSKRAVFDPRIEINYRIGAHECDPSGPVAESREAEIKLLHYRHLGRDHYVRRYAARQERLCQENIEKGWSLFRNGAVPLHDYLRWHYDMDLEGRFISKVI